MRYPAVPSDSVSAMRTCSGVGLPREKISVRLDARILLTEAVAEEHRQRQERRTRVKRALIDVILIEKELT